MSKKKNLTPEEANEVPSAPPPETDAAVKSAAANEAPSSPDELLKAEKDRYVRLYAEYENYRKRSQRDREDLYRLVKSETVKEFLPVYDNLERALKQATADEAFKKGIEMTMTQLKDILKLLGVQTIEAVGQKFDPNLHNASVEFPDPSHEDGDVIEELKKGFTLGGKVIRYADVVVAKNPKE